MNTLFLIALLVSLIAAAITLQKRSSSNQEPSFAKAGPSSVKATVDPRQREIDDALFSGRKADAVRIYRSWRNCTTLESKAAVRTRLAELGLV